MQVVHGGVLRPAKKVSGVHGGVLKNAKSVRVVKNGQLVSILKTSVSISASSTSLTEGSTVVVTPAYSNPELIASYTWSYKMPGSTTWVNDAGTSTLSWATWGPGNWVWRLTVTQHDGTQVTSNEVTITVNHMTLSMSISNTNPTDGDTITFTASAGVTGQVASYSWEYLAPGSAAWAHWGGQDTTTNTKAWQSNSPGAWKWRVRVNKIYGGAATYSEPVDVTVKAKVYTEATALGGGDAGTIQTCLNIAAGSADGAGKGTRKARLSGTFTGGGSVRVPANVTVDAYGATFQNIQFFNAKTGDGQYNRAGGIVWKGGKFDQWNSKSTAWSISHCPSFHLEDAEIWNTTTKGHGIEINSSGGAAYGGDVRNMTDNDFKVKILNCTFNGMDQTPRDSGYDEAVHFDYAWIKNGTDQATAAGVVNDATVCHNILIRGCHFRRSRTFPYPTSIGNHKFTMAPTEGEAKPTQIHSHLRIDGCHFDQVGACSNVGSDTIMSAGMAERGTVHLMAFRQVQVINNHFNHNVRAFAYESRSDVPQTQGNIFVANNTLTACGHMKNHSGGWVSKNYPLIDTDINSNTGGRISGFYITGNLFTATVGAAQNTWLIRCNDVDTLHVNGNMFYGLIGNGNYTGKTGNRIHGSEDAPSGTVNGYQCRDNKWSSTNPPGADLATSNS